jgi:hypothetical protein
MLLGELVVKISVASLLAGIKNDTERLRYGILYRLVRANSLGVWSQGIDSALSLPGQLYFEDAMPHRRQMTERVASNAWQFDSVAALCQCLAELGTDDSPNESRVQGKQWIHRFVQLRNRTRGHGATPDSIYSRLCEPLELAISLFTTNHLAFTCQWASFRRSLSGVYKAAALSDDSDLISDQSALHGVSKDGVYAYIGAPRLVELVQMGTDPDDFYIANGQFSERGFECLSYMSDTIVLGDARPYVNLPRPLPPSETQGRLQLGGDLSNIPEPPIDYVSRQDLEKDLMKVLVDENTPVVTLRGRGGIGKTSLALSVLKNVASIDPQRFDCILWFSARDIDLLPEGPKRVYQNVLDEGDIASEFVQLLGPLIDENAGQKAIDVLSDGLRGAGEMPICCFVLDNLETVRNPLELYMWMYTNIRAPNKLLITTRQSNFNGDWSIEISGMNRLEFDDLVDRVGGRLGVLEYVDQSYRTEMFAESGGHPYVVKILLGEVKHAQGPRKVQRVMASEDEILDALFERTFMSLSPGAQRLFLSLAQWRSIVPRVAFEAVIMRPSNERIMVGQAIEELVGASMIDILSSEADGHEFISTPLAAALFGRKQLLVSPIKGAVARDVFLLQRFGTGDTNAVQRGIDPHIEKFTQFVAETISNSAASEGYNDSEKLLDKEYGPMLEYIARNHNRAWLMLAELYEQISPHRNRLKAQECLRRFLMNAPASENKADTWRWLASSYRQAGNVSGEVHALTEMCASTSTPFYEISSVADYLNSGWSSFRREDERSNLAKLLVDIAEGRLSEARANDHSRIAWLCIHLRQDSRAGSLVRRGLRLDPYNEHLVRLAGKLGISPAMAARG